MHNDFCRNTLKAQTKKGSAGMLAAFCVAQQSYTQFLWISLCSCSFTKQKTLADRSLAGTAQ
jgi:hypothetical protein